MKHLILFLAIAMLSPAAALADTAKRKSVIVQSVAGSDDPTRATLALIGAWGIAEAGHDVAVVLAGEAVYLLNPTVASSTVGVGLGDVKSWLDKLRKHKVRVYYCGACSKARDVQVRDATALGATAIDAKQWGKMVVDADKIVTY